MARLLQKALSFLSFLVFAPLMTLCQMVMMCASAALDFLGSCIHFIISLISDLLLRPVRLILSVLTGGIALIISLFDFWLWIVTFSFDFCKASARAIVGRPAGLVLSYLDVPALQGLTALVMDPLKAMRQTQLAFSSPLAELTDWRAVAPSPSQLRGRMKGLETELHAARQVLDADRATVLALLDDRAALEAAWRAAKEDLDEAYDQIRELESELAVVEEARAVMQFVRERHVMTGDSSGSGATRSPQAVGERPIVTGSRSGSGATQSPQAMRRGTVDRRMGLSCLLE